MKHILLLGALFLFGATASAQSSSCTGSKSKTECTKSKSSCCQGKADAAKSCCSAKSSCSDTKGKKGKKSKAAGKEKGKQSVSLVRTEEKTDKKAKISPAKGS
jgi:hypothetical protein